MKYSAITGPVFEQHNREGHVECWDRLLGIIDRLPPQVPRSDPVPATPADIERVHHPGYLKWLRAQCERNTEYDFIRDYVYIGGSFTQSSLFSGYIDENTYINPHSYEVATYAAGSAIAASERTLEGESCFALVRPPGHHAAAAWAMGFCIINNIAIAAAQALEKVNRVAIIDWDVHHGNGTQDIFYTNGHVLYCSTHQDDLFPQTGHIEETGSGDGVGFTINAPLPRKSTIADYSLVFQEVFLPAIARMDPDLILISAGQDVLSDDPVGDMQIQPGGPRVPDRPGHGCHRHAPCARARRRLWTIPWRGRPAYLQRTERNPLRMRRTAGWEKDPRHHLPAPADPQPFLKKKAFPGLNR